MGRPIQDEISGVWVDSSTGRPLNPQPNHAGDLPGGGNIFSGSGSSGPGAGSATQGGGDGRPEYPTYIGMDETKLRVPLNRAPLEKFVREAMTEGPSKYSRIAMEQERKRGLMDVDMAKAAAQGAANTAKANASMRGGLNAGAEERLGKAAINASALAGQQAASASSGRMASIGMEDARAKTQGLAQAAGLELQGLQPEENAVNRIQLENTKKNAFNMGKYQEAMRGWAANQQAGATAASGGGKK